MNSHPPHGGRRTELELRKFAGHLHACGERATFEFIADLARGRPLEETVADFARLNSEILTELTARMAPATSGRAQ